MACVADSPNCPDSLVFRAPKALRSLGRSGLEKSRSIREVAIPRSYTELT